MAGDVKNSFKPAPVEFDCCKDKKATSICVCILCDAMYHVSCADRKKFVSFGKVLGVCLCRLELTSKPDTKLTKEQAKNFKLSSECMEMRQQLIRKNEECEKLSKRVEEMAVDSSEVINDSSTNSGECNYVNMLKSKIDDKDSLIEEIKDKNILLKKHIDQLNDNIALLKEKIGPHGNQTEVMNYSQVVKSDAVNDRELNIPAVIVHCIDERDIESVHLEAKQVLMSDRRIQVNKIIKTKDKVIIRCNRASDVQKAKESLDNFEESVATVQIEEKIKPRLKIVEIDAIMGESEQEVIERDVMERNFLNNKEDFLKVVYKYKNAQKNSWSVLIEVNARTYEKIMKKRRVYVGALVCPVFDDFNLNICNNCSKYGHSSKKCKDKKCVCKFCAGNHISKDCITKDKEDLQCNNCIVYNTKNDEKRQVNHSADDKRICQTYRDLLKYHLRKMDYPYNPCKEGTTAASTRKQRYNRNKNVEIRVI